MEHARSEADRANLPTAWVRVCGWCDRTLIDGAWRHARPADPAGAVITHGICDACLRAMSSTVDHGPSVSRSGRLAPTPRRSP